MGFFKKLPSINYSKQRNLYFLLSTLSLVEGLIAFISIASIPSDPKNAVVAGYSLSRLVILGCCIILMGIQVFILVQSKKVIAVFNHVVYSKNLILITKWIGVISGIFIWLTVWFPATRLEELSASYLRIRPLLLWIELIVFQFYIFIKSSINEIELKRIWLNENNQRKTFLLIFIVFIFGIVTFEFLRIIAPEDVGHRLIFPPGAPISALQLLFAWVIFLGIYLLEQKNSKFKKIKGGIIATCLLLWLTAFTIWNITPLACTDDRPGPFPPNYQCYPSINDAVYSIGSHYITLGEGIYNHWMTDKPLYMIFLALCEFIAGPRIDRYLVIQIAVLSTIPALLFLLGRKYSGYAGGFFLAILSILLTYNEINLYRQVGGVNAKLENTELLTSLFLIIACFCVIKWWNQSNKLGWAAVSGAVLGGASLIRLNPLFIVPVLFLTALITGWKRKKSLFSEFAVFIISFLLVFSPAIVSARNSQGINYYWTKIKNVIAERYAVKGLTETPIQLLQATESFQPIPDSAQNVFNYPIIESAPNDGMSIITYFLNSEYSSMAILPVNFSLISIDDQVNQPLWNFVSRKLIWNSNLSIENFIVLALNWLTILIGIWASIKMYGLAGLTALLIQIGYNIGNAVAKTSGGRYLQPVNWVTLFYFSLGIATLTYYLIRIFCPAVKSNLAIQSMITSKDTNQHTITSKKCLLKLSFLLVLFLAFGMIVPMINHLPSRLPDEVNNYANHLAADKLQSTSVISTDQWQEFVQDANHLVVQGKAYNPRYYRNNFYRSGDLSFEMMVLGNNHVFVSYLFNNSPDMPFTDGSDVILVGCRLRNDTLWAADRIILRTFAIIQLDHEKGMYVDSLAAWNCE